MKFHWPIDGSRIYYEIAVIHRWGSLGAQPGLKDILVANRFFPTVFCFKNDQKIAVLEKTAANCKKKSLAIKLTSVKY